MMSKTSYNQLQTHLRHCTVFWHKWPVHDLVLVIPPPSLIKVASNRRPYSKLGGTTLDGRKEGGQYYISQTFDQEPFAARKVVFSWECLNIFATGCSFSGDKKYNWAFQGVVLFDNTWNNSCTRSRSRPGILRSLIVYSLGRSVMPFFSLSL